MKRYAIHAETQPVPNRRTGAVDRRFVFWHVVVVGTELDELGDLHAVCGAVVDPMPWRRPLRDWLALTPGMRCPACDKAVGKDLKAVTDQIGSPIWE
jgi:hypothetical protein